MATDAERAALVLRIRTLSGGSKSELADHIEADGIELARLAAENEGIEAAISKVGDPSVSVRDNILHIASRFDAEVKHRMRADSRIAALEAAMRELLELADWGGFAPCTRERARALLAERKP
jgi:hypothetical protein